jgi:hypothetical protein
MKTLKLLTIGTLITLVLFLAISCKKNPDQSVLDAQANTIQAQQNANEAQQAANEAQQDADISKAENTAWKDWQDFKSNVDAVIAANNRIIANYKARMKDANGKYSALYDRKIETLEFQNKQLKAKLDAYKTDGKKSWEVFANEFSRDLNELGNALKGFVTN